MRILDNLLDPTTPAPTRPAARLMSGTARWADRHHPTRAILRTYHRRADTLYWERSPDTMQEMRAQVGRLEAIREPLAKAAQALAAKFPEHQHLADELTRLWEWPDVARTINGQTLYRIDYIGWLLTEYVEEMQEAAKDPEVVRVLANHLPRP